MNDSLVPATGIFAIISELMHIPKTTIKNDLKICMIIKNIRLISKANDLGFIFLFQSATALNCPTIYTTIEKMIYPRIVFYF